MQVLSITCLCPYKHSQPCTCGLASDKANCMPLPPLLQPYTEKEIRRIVDIRSEEEDVELTEDGKDLLTKIGAETSLRWVCCRLFFFVCVCACVCVRTGGLAL